MANAIAPGPHAIPVVLVAACLGVGKLAAAHPVNLSDDFRRGHERLLTGNRLHCFRAVLQVKIAQQFVPGIRGVLVDCLLGAACPDQPAEGDCFRWRHVSP
jgi:hypothetical protein